jgi:hypothetical protein
MAIIEFKPNHDEFLSIDEMNLEQLKAYQAELLEELAALDAKEPKNMNSEAYEEWGDAHEELEDLLDEIQDRLDELEA